MPLSTERPQTDILVAFHSSDKEWADWVCWEAQYIGFSVRSVEFGSPFTGPYDDADQFFYLARMKAEATLVLISPQSLAHWDKLEWQEVMRTYGRTVLPIEIRKTDASWLRSVPIFGTSESQATERLFGALQKRGFAPSLPYGPAWYKAPIKKSLYPEASLNTNSTKKWDAFFVYSRGDRDEVIFPLAEQLGRRGLRVALLADGTDLSIEEGISQSHCTALFVTPALLNTEWPAERFFQVIRKPKADQPLIIPILHGVTPKEAGRYVDLGLLGPHRSTSEGLSVIAAALELLIRDSFAQVGLLGPDGRPLGQNSAALRTIISDVQTVSSALLIRLAREPRLLYQLSPRLFEEVVAELLARQGYEITLTPPSKDGGKDIYAAIRNELGSFLYVVECKKYSPDNPVKVHLVRSLYGVVTQERATAGILVTTSYFTKGAQEFQKNLRYQLSLRDYYGLHDWLTRIALGSRNPHV